MNNLIGDLHMHSNNSDGSLDVENLVFIAKSTGLDCVAITDHNFLNSRTELLELERKYGVKVIFAVEFSCFDYLRQRKVHVLCYNPIDEKVLMPVCEKATQIRIEVGLKKSEYVKKNFAVSQKLIDKHKSKSGCIYQQNLAHALLECGYTDAIYGKLYDSLSSKNLKIEVERDFDVRHVLRLIKKAGGKAVIAHPGVYDSFELIAELISEHLIDGLEVWHPKNSELQTKELLNCVEVNDLIATGGTDFHGLYSSHHFSRIGNFFTPDQYLKKLLN